MAQGLLGPDPSCGERSGERQRGVVRRSTRRMHKKCNLRNFGASGLVLLSYICAKMLGNLRFVPPCSALNARAPPSIACLQLITTQTYPCYRHDQIDIALPPRSIDTILCSNPSKTVAYQIQTQSDPEPKRTSDTFAKVRQTR